MNKSLCRSKREGVLRPDTSSLWMELFSLDSVILIIVTCNCLPFSGSRSIFRRHVSWQVLKIAFRSLQTWKFSGGGHPETPPTRLVPSALAIMRPRYKKSSFGPVYASAETHLIEVCLVTLTVRSVCEREKEKRKWGTVHVTPLSLPIKTGGWYLQRRSHTTGRIFHPLKNLTGHFVHKGLWTSRRLISLYG